MHFAYIIDQLNLEILHLPIMEVPLNSLIPHKDIGAGQQFYLTYDQETFNIDLTGMIGVHLQFTYI